MPESPPESSPVIPAKGWSVPELVNRATAVVLVVGLIVGFGLGFLVEHSRIKTKNSHKKTAHSVTTKVPTRPGVTTPAPGAATAALSAIGHVSAVTAKVVTVKPAKGPAAGFAFWAGSLIMKAGPGKATDIAVGVHVVYQPGATATTAKEIVVLRGAQAKMGSLVTAATPTSMTYVYAGQKVTVKTSGAVVDTVTATTKAHVTNNAKAIAQGARIKAGVLLTEIVLLPNASAFN